MVKPGPEKLYPVRVNLRITEMQADKLDAMGEPDRSHAIRALIDAKRFKPKAKKR